jgi:SulP family sulfate permease
MGAIAENFHTPERAATVVDLLRLAVMIICAKFFNGSPGAILVCFGATAAVAIFASAHRNNRTRFGGIPSGLPHFAVPRLQPQLLLHLLSPAITVRDAGSD